MAKSKWVVKLEKDVISALNHAVKDMHEHREPPPRKGRRKISYSPLEVITNIVEDTLDSWSEKRKG